MELKRHLRNVCITLLVGTFLSTCHTGHVIPASGNDRSDLRADSVLKLMTLDEKIGQMYQISGGDSVTIRLIREGRVGSVINVIDPAALNNLQHIAKKESRLGIPLIIGRDVIHGFKTIFPIPLGQAATWNPELVRKAASIAAQEARSVGIQWTFAPMIDVSRDPRWGRIAESFGEDTYLVETLGDAMIKGFQGDDLSKKTSLAACAKHFAAYGAAEGGRDYNTVDISMQTLYNVYLPPFKKAVDNHVATFMVSFNEINGIPSSGNEFLVRDLLKNQWNFPGPVVSDWASVQEMISHGYATDKKQAAELAVKAGVDMEMQTTTYAENLKTLIREGKIDMKMIDDAVRRILRLKFQLGLFDDPYTDGKVNFDTLDKGHLEVAGEIAVQSLVLLKNKDHVLPLTKDLRHIAVMGPMADDGYEQLGTWIFDGEARYSVTPLQAIITELGKAKVNFIKVLDYSRQKNTANFDKALAIARKSDVVVVFAGEESILSGEAHCRADIRLPGVQEEMIKYIKKSGKPLILVVMAGRPIVLTNIEPYCDAILFAWHPGTMGGPAIDDVLFGKKNPSGKLPVSFPTMSGQIPIYYAHKNTGRPANAKNFVGIDDIPVHAFQTSLGNTSSYLDAGYAPAYPFGFGLSYTTFKYSDPVLNKNKMSNKDTLHLSVKVQNTGPVDGTEVVQLYIRDLVGSTTRPVKELKAFRRVFIRKGEEAKVEFKITRSDLTFYNKDLKLVAEPGDFVAFVGGNSRDCKQVGFRLVP